MSSLVPVGSAACLISLALSLVPGVSAQTYSNRRSSSAAGVSGSTASATANPASDPSAVTRTVSGRVINALTGAPVPRALVNLNARAVLTDPQGRFSFAGFTDATGYAQVTKPGYSATEGVEAVRQQKIPDLDALVELKLYPDAILTGSVTGPDGLPLARTQVRLHRLTFDSTGPRWLSSGFTQTDVHGEFRFETPAGRYRVNTLYVQRSQERGEAVLPVSFPASTGSSTESLELTPGEQRQLSLRPYVGPGYPLQLVLDGGDFARGLRFTAITPSGIAFQFPSQHDATTYTAQLPAGTFLLRANTGEREEAMQGETRIVISTHGTNQTSIHLTPDTQFPVEATVDLAPATSASSTPTVPSLQQYNLTLHNLANNGEGIDQDSRVTVQPDNSAKFYVSPGRYRLGGGMTGAWYVRSATCGPTNLMLEDLVVADGAGGSPIRLVVSNATGRIRGTVTTAGQPATGWVYLIPQQSSLVPYIEIYIQPDGTFQWSGAPGSYLAVPSGQQVREDFRKEAFLHRFAVAGREVQITPDSDTTTDLTLAVAGVVR